MSRWPDFFIAGASKSGTSSLVALLAQHPQIAFGPVKEPGYFLGQGGGLFLEGPGDRRRHAGLTLERSAYLALYARCKVARVGDASSNYLYDPLAAEAIHSLLPEARIIFILRDPVQRAVSAYKHLRGDGDEPIGSFAEALEAEGIRKESRFDYLWRYRECGEYARHLRPWLQLFPAPQIHFAIFEDLIAQPDRLAREIAAFLGLESPSRAFLPVHENASGRTPAGRLAEGLSGGVVGRLWRHWLPVRLRLRVRAAVPKRRSPVPATPEELDRLRSHFYPQFTLLRDLLNQTTSKIPPWLEYDALQKAARFME
jgi:hypothetical protein